MTPSEEDAEIIRNARAADRAWLDGGEGIDRDQLHDVYRLVAEAIAEREK